MLVTLKHLGFEVEADPLSRTVTVLWELENTLPWFDNNGTATTIIHKIKPVILQKKYTPIYERITDDNSNK